MAHPSCYAPARKPGYPRLEPTHIPDSMSDIIQGPVTRVIDGDTFAMTVTHTGTNNVESYNNTETIRIAGFDAPELPSRAGQRSKEALALKLSGKTVRCTVQARDTYGRIVATVSVI